MPAPTSWGSLLSYGCVKPLYSFTSLPFHYRFSFPKGKGNTFYFISQDFTILSAEKCSKTTFFRSRLCKYSDYQLKQEHGGNNLQERFFLKPLDQSLPYRLHFVDGVSASNAL